MMGNKDNLIDFLLAQKVLLFGDFILKSGRKSPYFFNAGEFKTGKALSLLGEFYADKIVESEIEYDLLFGPAYKGIPLVSAVSIGLYKKYGLEKPFCFNRKEVKDHGEGGLIVGEKLHGKVLIIDDVITRGTAFLESKKMIESHGASVAGLVISLDRQEKGVDGKTAIEEIRSQGIEVLSLLTVRELIKSLESRGDLKTANLIQGYLSEI